jgi:site-specific recombinase XerD
MPVNPVNGQERSLTFPQLRARFRRSADTSARYHQHQLRLFPARRADIECFARDLEARGRARATVTRRVCTIAGFSRYAIEEELLDHSPATHLRRPRLDYESHATGLDRNELGALLIAAGLGPPAEHALISLLARNGPRGFRSHRRQHPGPRRRTRPPDPGDHPQGRQDRHHPARPADRAGDRPGHRRALRRTARHAGITKPVGLHTLRHTFIIAALDAGVPLRDVQEAASRADPPHHHAL